MQTKGEWTIDPRSKWQSSTGPETGGKRCPKAKRQIRHTTTEGGKSRGERTKRAKAEA